ncbi:MAG: nucleoside deaminase, partial [Methylobacterium sp.]
MSDHARYLSEAVQLAADNVCDGGTPYGAVLVRGDEVLARVANNVHTTNDPTGHAEMVALREASRRLNSRDLSGSVMYASGQPC